MEMEHIILSATITIFSLGMFIVSLFSYRKSKNVKLMFVGSAFFVFFVKGVVQSVGIFSNVIRLVSDDISMKIFDVIILLLLFIATLKR